MSGPETARSMWRALETLHMTVYFAPEPRDAYRRTRFVVVRSPAGTALLRVARASDEPLFAPITGVELLAGPDECRYVIEPEADTGIPSELARVAPYGRDWWLLGPFTSPAGDWSVIASPLNLAAAYRDHDAELHWQRIAWRDGLGIDLTSWPQRMVDGFVARGFRVVRFDNRDIGRSSRVDTPPPGRLRQAVTGAAPAPTAAAATSRCRGTPRTTAGAASICSPPSRPRCRRKRRGRS